jgi:hypothetical protein
MYAGLDVGFKRTAVCVVDETGRIVWCGAVDTQPEALGMALHRFGTLPFWAALRRRPLAQAAMRGANAAVVGILGAALYDPIWTGAILSPRDFGLAVVGFVLLVVWKTLPCGVVLLTAAAGAALAVAGGQ